MNRMTFAGAILALCLPLPCFSAELILPLNRTAFYAAEEIELAVAGLKKGQKAQLELAPASKGLTKVTLTFTGDGGTVAGTLPAYALAPSAYALTLDGKPAGKLTIATGIPSSPLFLSATVGNPKTAGANFLVSNAFGFGLFDAHGKPLKDIRGRRSGGMEVFERAITDNLPSLVYMYWTGYVTHKPFGSEKSWAARDMMEATRLLSFHTAQRLRRYDRNVLLVGTLDEPGLSWGKTPAGGMASGFPNWDEEDWYKARGWKYTQGPASRDDADWMKYLTIRCAIMKEMNAQAKRDLMSIWPSARFSTDLYAPHALMDGTDPLNQQVNDVPSSHVFVDWGTGRVGALSGLYLEKCDDPRRKAAHAMNGQLFGAPVPQPHQSNAYRVTLNALLAAGLSSNWWLNPTGMKNEDLAKINEPALRLGGLFDAFAPTGHDVAVLWSFTEIGMRLKDITAKEAKKKTGEQIKLLIASLPDVPGARDKEVEVNAYNVGGNYKEQVLNAHQGLARAGYPTHILHERVLKDQLARYKTLVIVGQTFELPADVRKVIDDWAARGGQVVVDGTTKVKFKGAIVTKADFRDPGFRWSAFYTKAEQKKHPFKNDREASVYHTNYFMDEMARQAAPHLKEAMRKTKSRPAIETGSMHLLAEKHTSGDAALYMVLNAHDKLPDIAADRRHWLYNFAPLEATFTLQGVPKGSFVYCFEGADWKKVRQVKDFDKPIKGSFEPGEMKLFLVLPAEPNLSTAVSSLTNALNLNFAKVQVHGKYGGPIPVRVRFQAPDGADLFSYYDRTSAAQLSNRTLPIGGNVARGKYRITIENLLPGLPRSVIQHPPFPTAPALRPIEDAVRVIDFFRFRVRPVLRRGDKYLVAYGPKHKAVAEKLAADLKAKRLDVVAKPEGEVLRKVAYPRVWNPYADVFMVDPKKKEPKGLTVKTRITLTTAKDGTVSVKSSDQRDVSQDWKQPNSIVTIAGEGQVDFSGDREQCYSPGVKLYFDKDRRLTVLNATKQEEKTTPTFRTRWARPWHRLTTHHGAYQLPPQLPEAFTTDSHLILLGTSTTSDAVAALQASELLLYQVDAKYPGPGKALIQLAFSPFAVEKNVVFVGASDAAGLAAGVKRLLQLVP